MPAVFSCTLRSFEADSFRPSLFALLIVAIFLGVWGIWFFLSEIALYEVTDKARLEVNQAVHPIEAPLIGKVVGNWLSLSKTVQIGDLLVELETTEYRLELAEERARIAAFAAELEMLHNLIRVEQAAQQEERQTSQAELDEARARYHEAKVIARIAQEEADRFTRLHSKAYLAEIDHLKAQAEAQKYQAAADVRRLAIPRLELVQRTKEIDRETQIEDLKRRITRLEGELKTAEAKLDKWQFEIERRRIRAPIAGYIGEVSELRIGVFVDEGDRLGAIVPKGKLKVIAYFLPSAALGRIKPGQPARLRIKGFPWTQYGIMPAVVANVGSEAPDGWVRVELGIGQTAGSAIPVQHGLPASVEVKVERT